MTNNFFISPFKPPDEWYGQSSLEVDPVDLMDNLKSRWPFIEITIDPQVPYRSPQIPYPTLEWEWEDKMSDSFIRGNLQANKQIIVIEGSTKELAEFVAWYRGLISSEYKLYFFHESLYLCIEVKPGAIPDEIVSAIEEGNN